MFSNRFSIRFVVAQHLYYNAEFATLPIIIISMILGEWSLNMLVHMLQPFYADFNPKPKYISILMILFFIKFQTVVSTQIVNAIEYEEPVLPRIMRNGEGGRFIDQQRFRHCQFVFPFQ